MTENGKAMIEKAVETPVIEWDHFLTSTGVLLELHPIPGGRIEYSKDLVPRPRPPIIKATKEGENDLENHADPRYLAAMDEYEHICRQITLNISLAEGTKVISVPDGMFGPDDDRWIEHVEDDELTTFNVSYLADMDNNGRIGLGSGKERTATYTPKVHRTGKLRYIDYLTHYALGDGDYKVLLNKLTSFAGKVMESDVDEAEESFRNSEGRNTPTRISPRPRPGRES